VDTSDAQQRTSFNPPPAPTLSRNEARSPVVVDDLFEAPEGDITFDLPPNPVQEGATDPQPQQPPVDCSVKSPPTVKKDPSLDSVSEGAIVDQPTAPNL
jgi:hypothetical protein